MSQERAECSGPRGMRHLTIEHMTEALGLNVRILDGSIEDFAKMKRLPLCA